MQKKQSKLPSDHIGGNIDYLNFIRRNQQIVKQFKEISQVQRCSFNIESRHTQLEQQRKLKNVTIQVNRYAKPLPVSTLSHSIDQKTQNFNLSQNCQEDITCDSSEFPLHPRKLPTVNPQDSLICGKTNSVYLKSNNCSITNSFTVTKDNDKFREALPANNVVQMIRFPQIGDRVSHIKNQRHLLEQLVHKQVINPRKYRKGLEEISLCSTEAVYQESGYKSKSANFLQPSKARFTNQTIKTYYDYENLLESKEKVTQLSPTLKALRPKKKEKEKSKQKIYIPLGQYRKEGVLEQYLGTRRIEATLKHPHNKTRRVREGSQQTIPENIELTDVATIAESQKIQNNQDIQDINDILDTPVQEQQSQVYPSNSCDRISSSPSPLKRKKLRSELSIKSTKPPEQTVYQSKIRSYREFLFLVNFAHRVFDPLVLSRDAQMYKPESKYRYYIGRGNNKLLLRSLMKRRFWWVEVDDHRQANFVWTQIKINAYYQFQKRGQIDNKYDKLEEEHLCRSKKKANLRNKSKNRKEEGTKPVCGILRGKLPENQKKIFTKVDCLHYHKMLEGPQKGETLRKFEKRLNYLPSGFLARQPLGLSDNHIHNHFVNNFEIGNKKALFYHLKHYYELIGEDPFRTIPLTYHLKQGINDPQYHNFVQKFNQIKADYVKAEKTNESTRRLSRNVWIIKPGECSNRGKGITVIDELYELNTILKTKQTHADGQLKTYIIQKYIEKPMLYKNRKFDIRHYLMISRLHGRMRAYFFSQGYIRTSSYQYNVEQVSDVMIHLTNDAIQKNSASYGKYQEGNKLSYAQFQRYLQNTYPERKYSFADSIYPRMRQIATDAIKSTYLWMDPNSSEHNFEVFGLDFMIDSHFNVWLIEVNTNPCLELSSQLLTRIIPTMLEHSLRLAVDPIFPPTAHYPSNIKYLAPTTPLQRLQFELIFDESRDGKKIESLYLKHGRADCGVIEEEDETYENDGKQIEICGDLQ